MFILKVLESNVFSRGGTRWIDHLSNLCVRLSLSFIVFVLYGIEKL